MQDRTGRAADAEPADDGQAKNPFLVALGERARALRSRAA